MQTISRRVIYGFSHFRVILNRPGFDAASFCVKDGDYGQALPGRAA
jgi:hypothetical protein